MKKSKLTFVLILMASFLLVFSSSSIASLYSGAWAPDDEDILTMDVVAYGDSTDELYLFDWGDDTNSLLIFNDAQDTDKKIYFQDDTAVDGNWYVSLDQDWDDTDNVNLESTNTFGFYFYDGSTKYKTYDLVNLAYPDFWKLTESNTGMIVEVSDATVPIPTAALLFGTGLVGLVGIRRKFKS